MKNKKKLVLIIALILTAIVAGVAFAGPTGACKKCDCAGYTYDQRGGNACTCGHLSLDHYYK